MAPSRRCCFAAVTLTALAYSSSLAIESDQQKSIDRIAAGLKTAGTLYQQGEYKRCATMIGGAQRLIDQLVEEGDQEVLQQLRPLHRMMTRAHALLSAKDVELVELKPLPGEQLNPILDQLAVVKSAVTQAGLLYQQEKYSDSAAQIASAQQQLAQLRIAAPGAAYEEAKKLHAMISKAHQLLGGKDVDLPELAPLSPPGDQPTTAPSGGDNPPQAVSFGRDVAPILATHCGRCHVRESRGELSLATFQSIMRGAGSGPTVVPGKPDDSPLLQLIESGEMPPQRGRQAQVPAAEVQKIRAWIEQGGRFDGSNEALPLTQVIEESRRVAPQQTEEARRRSPDDDARQTGAAADIDPPADESTTR